MNQEELKNLYYVLNKELDRFNSEFFFEDENSEEVMEEPIDDSEPYTLNEFLLYLTHDEHNFLNEIQPYRERIFKNS